MQGHHGRREQTQQPQQKCMGFPRPLLRLLLIRTGGTVDTRRRVDGKRQGVFLFVACRLRIRWLFGRAVDPLNNSTHACIPRCARLLYSCPPTRESGGHEHLLLYAYFRCSRICSGYDNILHLVRRHDKRPFVICKR